MSSDFSIQEIWNKSFDLKNYEAKPRNYLRASEIGKPFLDVYLACKGIEPSNPYDERIMRKFEAGRLFEWLIGNVFRKSGLEVKSNESIPPIEIPDCLRVYGHYDFLVSGGANWKEAEERVKAEKFPSGIESVCLNLVKWLRERYPIVYGPDGKMIAGLTPILYEIKSVNSMVFWANSDRLLEAYPEHVLQLYTYLRGLNMESGRILYVSKDDLTLREFEVSKTFDLVTKWMKWVEGVSSYILNDAQPEPEPDIVYDSEEVRWDINWKMERSVYLTHITGLSKEDWSAKWRAECTARNRVLGTEKGKETRKAKRAALAAEGAKA